MSCTEAGTPGARRRRCLVLLTGMLVLGACTPAPPDALISTMNYALDREPPQRGPQAASGAYVWAHGKAGGVDQRGLPLPAHVRAFADAGYDVFRFDRVPYADDRVRAGFWLQDCLRLLRRMGYRRIVVAGQSRGAWNALGVIDTPGLADVVLAFSPAAQGTGPSTDLSAQTDDLRAIVRAAPASPVRLAFVQFGDDRFAAGPAARARIVEQLRPRIGGLLVIDRPPGFIGHGAANGDDFAQGFSACLLAFAQGSGAQCPVAGAAPPPGR